MLRRDKLKNIEQANLMLEQSYLKSKGLLKGTNINEEVIDFTNKDQYADFLQNKTKELEGKKVKLNIYDTFAAGDSEKEKFTGNIIVELKKRTGRTGDITFDAILIDNGGYKYMAPAKGKTISITIPATSTDKGGFRCEDPKIAGLFKVKTLEALNEQSYLKSKGLLFERHPSMMNGIDIEAFYNYSQKPDPKMKAQFEGKDLFLDDLVRTRDGQALLQNPKLAGEIKNLNIKINPLRTEISHPQELAIIIKSLIKPGVLNFDDLVKTKGINDGLKNNSNWTQEVYNKVASKMGMEDGELSSYAIRLVNGK